MKKFIIKIIQKIIILQVVFFLGNFGTENYKNCASCTTTLQQAQIYINQLEKTCKLLHDDVARWMKLYSEEISNKASSIEKNLSWYMDYIAKFIALEQKVVTGSHAKK
jgi:hypothetical protein